MCFHISRIIEIAESGKFYFDIFRNMAGLASRPFAP